MALGRSPSKEERRTATEYLHEATHVVGGERQRMAWSGLARVLFGSNEFIYVD